MLTSYRVQAGRWQGPWATAKALEAACDSSFSEFENIGLQIRVLDEPGGGVPQLYIGRYEVDFVSSL